MKGVKYHRWLAVLMLGAILGACSSPNPTLYTIAPIDGTEQSGGPRVVLLQQIGLDRYLERSQIVRSSEDYRLDVLANDWWGVLLTSKSDEQAFRDVYPFSPALVETLVAVSSFLQRERPR